MKKSIVISLTIVTLILYACNDKNEAPSPSAPPINETELITTMKLIFTDTVSHIVNTATFYDLDDIGGNPPSILDTIELNTNRVYQTEIILLDQTKNPLDSISNKVLNEGEDHLFIFTKSGAEVSFNITDRDKNNLPIGLNSIWLTGTGSNGTITVILKHQPGIKDGTAALGQTDVQVTFPCRIK